MRRVFLWEEVQEVVSQELVVCQEEVCWALVAFWLGFLRLTALMKGRQKKVVVVARHLPLHLVVEVAVVPLLISKTYVHGMRFPCSFFLNFRGFFSPEQRRTKTKNKKQKQKRTLNSTQLHSKTSRKEQTNYLPLRNLEKLIINQSRC